MGQAAPKARAKFVCLPIELAEEVVAALAHGGVTYAETGQAVDALVQAAHNGAGLLPQQWFASRLDEIIYGASQGYPEASGVLRQQLVHAVAGWGQRDVPS